MSSACKTPEQPEFIQLQYAFAGNIRNPEGVSPPVGVDARRMAVYRELFYNNIESLLANTFPVLRQITPPARWHRLVRQFLMGHRARTPFFPKLPGEFVEALPAFLSADDPPYLTELAQYEWLEMELALAEQAHVPLKSKRDPTSLRLSLSPLARALTFSYPVHRIGPAFLPDAPEPTHIVVYRGRDDSVRFLELNPLTAQLLHCVESAPRQTAGEQLRDLADDMAHPNPAAVIEGGLQTLRDLLERGVLEASPTAREA